MEPLITIRDLQVSFPVGKVGILGRPKAYLQAVAGVSLDIRKGETLGLVGESGSGKTTLGRALLRLQEPTGGNVIFNHDDRHISLAELKTKDLRRVWRHMQMVFQDPYASLNPRMTVREIIAEPLKVHRQGTNKEILSKVEEIAELCGLQREQLRRYPHAFSGGQRQRIAIARALALMPEFIVCDEPVSALDVSIQAQILNLLKELQKKLGLTYLFIAHDLAAVAYICDRVAVMYLGQIVELADSAKLYYKPRHPYTEALMSAIPDVDPDRQMTPVLLSGERPNPANPPAGCRFHTRCRYADQTCQTTQPPLRDIGSGHFVACHYAETLELKGALEQNPGGNPTGN
jgi:oligopeptide/dipeptide ABC transporter ATP-binding protein